MEFLRLMSMALVLVIHANTAYQPWPIDQTDVQAVPVHCFLRFLIESLCIVCVNAFVLLSGWFGIKFSLRRLLSFIFQVLFFSLILSFLPNHQGKRLIIDIVTLNQYWFVRAYIILFIISPALNLLAEHAPKKVFQYVLVAFFVMQTVFSYISNSSWFDDGFSPLPFIGLYLLSRYIRIYQPKFATFKKQVDLAVYLGVTVLLATLSVVLFKWFGTGGRMFNYTNPLVILSSVSFLLFFTKIKMKDNRVINWIAASSVGAYLLHMNPCFFQSYYIHTLQSFSRWDSSILICIAALVFMIAVFFAGVLLDKIRGLLWNGILNVSKNAKRV